MTEAQLTKDKKTLVLTVKNHGLSDQVLKHTYITVNNDIKVPIKGLKSRESIKLTVDLSKHKKSWNEYIFGMKKVEIKYYEFATQFGEEEKIQVFDL